MSREKNLHCNRCGKKILESRRVMYGSRCIAAGTRFIFCIDERIEPHAKCVKLGSRLVFCNACTNALEKLFANWYGNGYEHED